MVLQINDGAFRLSPRRIVDTPGRSPMTLLKPCGVWPATLVPFQASGEIDQEALLTHLTSVSAVAGVQGVVVNGEAGQVSSLTPEERCSVINLAKRVCGDRLPVIAGVVAGDPGTARSLAREAQASGADGILLFPITSPGEQWGDRQAVISIVGSIAESSGMPMVLFQVAASQAGSYPPDILRNLCSEVDAVVGVKEGSNDPVLYEVNLRNLRSLRRHVSVLSTNTQWLLASLAIGADGVISGIGSVAAEVLVEIFDAMQAGRLEQARLIGDRLFPLNRAFYGPGLTDCHTRMKLALQMLGRLDSTAVRPPLLPLPDAEAASIRSALLAAGLLQPSVDV